MERVVVRTAHAAIAVLASAALSGCQFSARAANSTADAPGSAGPDATDAADAPDAPADAPIDAPDESVLAVLNGQHWLIPCVQPLGNQNCTCGTTPGMSQVTIAGTTHWRVTIRIRGAMEGFGYENGLTSQAPSGWYVGGDTLNDTGDNVYELTVSSPAHTYFLNEGSTGHNYSIAFDYMATLDVDGGATISFYSSGQDGRQWANFDMNGNAITFAGVATTPDPYDGQFAQLDVVSATAL